MIVLTIDKLNDKLIASSITLKTNCANIMGYFSGGDD